MKKVRIPAEDPEVVRARDKARLDEGVQRHSKGVFSYAADDAADGVTPPRRSRGERDGADIGEDLE